VTLKQMTAKLMKQASAEAREYSYDSNNARHYRDGFRAGVLAALEQATAMDMPKRIDAYCNGCGTSYDDCERARVPHGLACCGECSRYSSHNARKRRVVRP